MTMKHIKEITDAMMASKPHAYVGVLEKRLAESDKEIVRLNNKLAGLEESLTKQAEFWEGMAASNKEIADVLGEGSHQKILYNHIVEIYQFHTDYINMIINRIKETE